MNDSPQSIGLGIFRRLAPHIRPYWIRLAVGIVAGVLAGGSIFGVFKFTADIFGMIDRQDEGGATPAAQVVTRAEEPPSNNDILGRVASVAGIPAKDMGKHVTRKFVMITAFIFPILILARNLLLYLSCYYMRWVAQRVVRDLRDSLFDRIQSQSLAFFGRSDVGSLISRCTNDTGVVEQTIANTVADIVRSPVEIIAAFAFALYFAIKCNILGFFLVMILAIPLCIVPVILLGRVVRRHSHKALERVSDLVTRMHETFTGVRIVKAFHMEKAESTRFTELNRKYFKSVIRALRAELLMSPLMEIVASLVICFVLLFGFARDIRLAELLPFLVAAVWSYQPMKKLAQINANLQRGAAALDRVFGLLDTDTAIRESPNPVILSGFNDRITFEDVAFSYGEGLPPVLENIDIVIPRGHVVAVVGETGSGKTTMAGLLARFYDPTGGRVTIDGKDLRDVQVASLRRLIAVVTQETVLFNDTVANNISYGTPEATRAQIEEAARMANAHEFIATAQGGYERMAGEKGFVLSGGERQRIALARAILRNSPILILDEATSALDTVTERLVQEAITRVMENRTVFAIAHRLSTIKHANMILLIDKGRIVERGTHEELYNAGGRYRKLCDMQVLGD